MSKLNDKKSEKWGGREIACIGVTITLLIVAQLALSFISGVELVSVLLASFSYIFGWKKGVVTALIFSLLRQFVFGFFPNVLFLYTVYFSLWTILFGKLGRKTKKLPVITLSGTLATMGFTLLDNLITPLWYVYAKRAWEVYAYASIATMIPHVLCVGATLLFLFIPLTKAFSLVRR